MRETLIHCWLQIYAADDIVMSDQAVKKFRQIEKMGFGANAFVVACVMADGCWHVYRTLPNLHCQDTVQLLVRSNSSWGAIG